ncbi:MULTISPECIES: UMP kinase [unclassified Fictibacillus]|uniref:UMP kinase n=1 Tax=unclassified Fictibacillus TaxID=2644029 RepID=UPI000782A0B6|nr:MULTISPECIES: UMP kinase [unclassified Fictibacillus]UZJ79972.1 UMP kinase [Fictibacillus sp. KU28468]
MLRYKKVLIKLSGGAVAGQGNFGFNPQKLSHIAQEMINVANSGVQVSAVIGGGNIFRGSLAEQWGMNRVEADQIGTLGTVINSLMLKSALKSLTDREVIVMASEPLAAAEHYNRAKSIKYLERGSIVLFAGGNGQPFVSTDYPAVQRALEMGAEALLVAKHGVDGVYCSDPKVEKKAKRYVSLSYEEAIKNNLKVMDQTAMILAKDFQLPIHLFNFDQKGAFSEICKNGHNPGTIISSNKTIVLI